MLSEKFNALLVKIGNPTLEHPVFYHTPVGIRFELGSDTPVYRKGSAYGEKIVNPQYIAVALQRAKAIYMSLPHPPNLLRIDTYRPESALEDWGGADLDDLQSLLSFPHERTVKQVNDGDDPYTTVKLYWNLDKMDFLPDSLLREIIKADLGGISDLASNVYFANTEDVYLYHVYDDRGADLVADNKEKLRSLYYEFYHWILNYDRERIDEQFAI